jgi:hypothetical protein
MGFSISDFGFWIGEGNYKVIQMNWKNSCASSGRFCLWGCMKTSDTISAYKGSEYTDYALLSIQEEKD